MVPAPPPPLPDHVELVRIDVPDLPGAVATSAYGSVFVGDPGLPGHPSRPEPLAEIDAVVATGAMDALAVHPWHARGHGGAGVKVAVFDSQWRDWELLDDELGATSSHDCFLHRSCERAIDSFENFSSAGRHGVACAEVIRDIAPDAELYLVRVTGLTSLENAVDWAIREDIDLISMSLSFFNESAYDGGGPVNKPMDKLVDAGILMVTSAGNYASEHWAGDWRDDDQDNVMEFHPGDEGLWVYWTRGNRRLDVMWDEWATCGETDLDVYVYDSADELVGRSTTRQRPPAQRTEDDSCLPVERTTVNAWEDGWYRVVLNRHRGQVPGRVDLFARGGDLERPVAAGSIVDPGTHPGVFTVGAVRARNYLVQDVEAFSSQGPTASGLNKPDIAGPNGLTTYAYGPTSFYGTSAATPAVTAALAVLMGSDPELTPQQAADQLMASAQIDAATWDGADPGLGAGRARLPRLEGVDGGCGLGRLMPMFCLVPALGLRRRSRRPRRTG